MKFRVGDKVKCSFFFPGDILDTNTVYTVLETVGDNKIIVNNCSGGGIPHLTGKFDLVKRKKNYDINLSELDDTDLALLVEEIEKEVKEREDMVFKKQYVAVALATMDYRIEENGDVTFFKKEV